MTRLTGHSANCAHTPCTCGLADLQSMPSPPRPDLARLARPDVVEALTRLRLIAALMATASPTEAHDIRVAAETLLAHVRAVEADVEYQATIAADWLARAEAAERRAEDVAAIQHRLEQAGQRAPGTLVEAVQWLLDRLRAVEHDLATERANHRAAREDRDEAEAKLRAVEGKYADCVAENNEYRRAAHPTSDPADNSLNRAKLRTETMLDDPAAGCSICGAKKPAFCAHAVIPDPATGAAVERERCARLVESATMVAGPDAGEVERSLTMGINFLLASIAVDIRAARSGG